MSQIRTSGNHVSFSTTPISSPITPEKTSLKLEIPSSSDPQVVPIPIDDPTPRTIVQSTNFTPRISVQETLSIPRNSSNESNAVVSPRLLFHESVNSTTRDHSIPSSTSSTPRQASLATTPRQVVQPSAPTPREIGSTSNLSLNITPQTPYTHISQPLSPIADFEAATIDIGPGPPPPPPPAISTASSQLKRVNSNNAESKKKVPAGNPMDELKLKIQERERKLSGGASTIPVPVETPKKQLPPAFDPMAELKKKVALRSRSSSAPHPIEPRTFSPSSTPPQSSSENTSPSVSTASTPRTTATPRIISDLTQHLSLSPRPEHNSDGPPPPPPPPSTDCPNPKIQKTPGIIIIFRIPYFSYYCLVVKPKAAVPALNPMDELKARLAKGVTKDDILLKSVSPRPGITAM